MKSKSKNVGLVLALVGLSWGFANDLGATATDDKIESSFEKSHVYQTYLKDDGINVDSENGVVTIKGTVPNESHRSLAEETLAALPGVKKVNNQLVVQGERSEGNSDAWIGTKVKAALLFHRNVDGLKTEVEVKDGLVTLRGNAGSEAEKELASEYAKEVEGVKQVNNQLVVTNLPSKSSESLGKKIDDASITAQVKLVLLYHRSTSALRTKVETKDGVVFLEGKAENAAEKDLVTKLVKQIDGVKSVVNRMSV